jgi:TolB-like protein/Tfp pilus assembly protein PilF
MSSRWRMLGRSSRAGPMSDSNPVAAIIRFGEYEADLPAGHLRRRGVRVRLRGQAFDVLSLLLERAGQVVTREELRRRLWPDEVFVDFDNNLNTAMARLREALHDSPEHPRFIETLPKRGYRFIADLTHTGGARERPRQPVRLVILPFTNLSGDAAEEYFSDAMTDEITTEVARLAPDRLAVIARTTAMRYKATRKDAARIGRELGVDYIVEGGVRRADGRVRVNVQLIRATNQAHVWAKRYDEELGDVFDLQGRIATELGSQTDYAPLEEPGSVPPPAESATRAPTGDLAAYNEYIQARPLMDRVTAESLARAREHLERAIQRDPTFALAYDALAEIYWNVGYFGFGSPRETFSTGVLFAVRALELDGSLAETHALLGQYHKQLDFNWPEVEREMDLALKLNPSSPIVKVRYAANLLMPLGRLEEAVQELERALDLDPLSTATHAWLAVVLMLARQYERAQAQARLLLDLEPASYVAYLILGGVHRERKAFEAAVEFQRTAVALSGGSAAMLGWLGLVLGQSGNAAEARELLQQLDRKAETAYVPPTAFAWIHLGLEDFDSAFDWLDRAIDARDQLMMPIKSYPIFDPIRADSRFAALLRKMNLDSQP